MGCVCLNTKQTKISSSVLTKTVAVKTLKINRNPFFTLTKKVLVNILDYLKYNELFTVGKLNRYLIKY